MTPLGDIRSYRLLYAKAILFLVLGGMASAILLAERPTLKVALLLSVAIWAFARAYYFAFYVIEHYVDREYKFSGLWSLTSYLLRRRGNRLPGEEHTPGDR